MLLDNMSIFASVVEHASFSSAAKTLKLPLSTVSRRISDLEQSLGQKLILRTTRKLEMTEAGRVLYEHCRDLTSKADDAKRALERLRDEPEGNVRLGLPFSVDNSFSSGMISKFMAEYRKITLDIIVSDWNKDQDLVNLDIKVSFGQKPVTRHQTTLLGNAKINFCASPKYLIAHGVPSKPADLGEHQLIRYVAPGFDEYTHSELLGAAFKYRINSHDMLIARQACVDGLGIGWLPNAICARPLLDGRLVTILEDHTNFLPIWMTSKIANSSTPKATLLAMHFKRIFQNETFWQSLESKG